MGHQSCCVKQQKLRKGLWSPEEDEKLYNHITRYGVGCWSSVPKLAGLQRCGKSCRLRWINYLRPDLKRGMFSQDEEDLILSLHESLGNRWAQIATQLPGRTDNEIKNYWNSCLKKKLMNRGIDPNTHKPIEVSKSDGTDLAKSGGMATAPNQTYHMNTAAIFGADAATDDFLIGKQSYDPSGLLFSEIQNQYQHQSILTRPCGPSEEGTVSQCTSFTNWGRDNKLEPMFEFPYSPIQPEEKKPTANMWSEANNDVPGSADFGSYPLASLAAGNLDAEAAFQQMYNKL